MSDIRLEEIPFTFNGKTYQLRCNMNVLADVQEACGGNIAMALNGERTLGSVMLFLAAMLNDYADEMDWPERWTAKQLGRKLSKNMLDPSLIMGLVTRALTPPAAKEARPESAADTGDTDPDPSGN